MIKYLDVTLNSNNGCYKLHTKDLYIIKYVSKLSNNPNTILGNLHKSIKFRLYTKSSIRYIFDKAKTNHTQALELNHHKVSSEYLELKTEENKKLKDHKHNTIGFNPPFSRNVKTNIGRFFSI